MRGYKNPFAILAESSYEEEEEEIGEEEIPDDVVPQQAKTVREEILESEEAKKWGRSKDGENQGVRHFLDYRIWHPDRIYALELRLGVGSFDNSLAGFIRFTQAAEHVIVEAEKARTFKVADGKTIYYLASTLNGKGVVVIEQHGKLQSMMLSDLKSFRKMK